MAYVFDFASSPLAKKVNVPEVKGEVEAAPMVTVAVADIVGVAVDDALIVTLPAAPGAVYVVFAPLAVCAGLNVPQEPEGVQLQSTPLFALSFATVAAIAAVWLGAMLAGGAVDSVTERFELEMVTVTVAVAVMAELTVAVTLIVTLPAVAGAVYVVLAPLAVCVGLNVPQAPEGAQLQSTPPFELSLATVAISVVV